MKTSYTPTIAGHEPRRGPRPLTLVSPFLLLLLLIAPDVRAGEEFEGEFFGGGIEGEEVVRFGEWTFEQLTPAQADSIDPCSFGEAAIRGGILDPQGWFPSPESNVLPRVEWMGEDWIDPEQGGIVSEDVGGGVLAFYDPDAEGFLPGHLSLMESPVLDLGLLGIEVAPLSFLFSSNCNPDPALAVLEWIVGIRTFDGVQWSPWLDTTVPLVLGPASYDVPLPLFASVVQLRVGIRNPSDILLNGKKAPVADKKKGKTKPPAVIAETWKYVPDIEQKGPTCAAATAADCLAYWASAGYPEIMPAASDTTRKHNKLREELEEAIYGKDKKVGGTGTDADSWPGGIIDYLKKKKVYDGTQTQGDTRTPLVAERYPDTLATWNRICDEFGQCNDVMLMFHWYDANGELIKVNGVAPAHNVTMGGKVTTQGGKSVIHVANPWGDQVDEVGPENRAKTYEQVEVEVVNGRVRLKNETLQKRHKGAYLCVSEVNVVKKKPSPRGFQPVEVDLATRLAEPDPWGVGSQASLADRGGSPSGATAASGRGLTTHGYAITNDGDHPLDRFALVTHVPYANVQSPPGWTWEPLPSPFREAVSCDQTLGPYGILWTTTSHPVPPGGFRSGFRFDADSSLPNDPIGLQWYTEDQSLKGVFGYVAGPVLVDPSTTPEPPADGFVRLQLRVAPTPVRGDATTRVAFSLPATAPVTLDVIDAAGRKVRRVFEGTLTGGRHELAWDGRDEHGAVVPSGVYFLRLEAGDLSASGRIVRLD